MEFVYFCRLNKRSSRFHYWPTHHFFIHNFELHIHRLHTSKWQWNIFFFCFLWIITYSTNDSRWFKFPLRLRYQITLFFSFSSSISLAATLLYTFPLWMLVLLFYLANTVHMRLLEVYLERKSNLSNRRLWSWFACTFMYFDKKPHTAAYTQSNKDPFNTLAHFKSVYIYIYIFRFVWWCNRVMNVNAFTWWNENSTIEHILLLPSYKDYDYLIRTSLNKEMQW